jgi:hypothetical protein
MSHLMVTVLKRTVALAVGFTLAGLTTAAVAIAEPATDPAPIPVPPGAAEAAPLATAAAVAAPLATAAATDPVPAAALDTGAVASEAPGIAKVPDGRTLTVAAKNETQLPVAPLTTSLSSRAYMVGGTFTGETTGAVEGGSLEVGYQIGCAIEMDKVKLNGSLGGTFGNSNLGIGGLNLPGTISVPIKGQVEVEPRPGTVTNVLIDKKSFKGTAGRITLKDISIKVDNCVGASSLRSYALLTSSTADEDDVVAYYGVTKVF